MALDVSIKNLKTHVFGPKVEKNRIKAANDILSQSMKVQEKIDGTKLTLIRTDKSDADNYANNWIVSYKDTVLFSDEFKYLTDLDLDNITSKSIGVSQYALVFKHLAKINKNISSIPTNTEFSIEFAQNKDTLTRTYENLGAMFLRTYVPTKYYIKNGTLTSIPQGSEEVNVGKIKKMANMLGIMNFPIIFDGKINTKENMLKGINDPRLQEEFTKVTIDWDNPLDIIEKFGIMTLNMPSTLGGLSEGVVLLLADGRLFKYVQSDQYDIETRDAKKSQYKLDSDGEKQYFIKIRKIVYAVLKKVNTNQTAGKIIGDFLQLVKRLPDDVLPVHPKKSPLQIRDDIHETVRLIIGKEHSLGKNSKSVGVIPIAGKPLHIGHWKLIELASIQNDKVVIYTSLANRGRAGEVFISGKSFAYFWNEYFMPILPKNVSVKFSPSPLRSAVHDIGWLEQILTQDKKDVPSINLYSDEVDIGGNFKDEELANNFPAMWKQNKIEKRGVSRESTVNISGTKMRKFLETNDKTNFIKYLPPIPLKQKQEMWNIMKADIETKQTATEQIKAIIKEVIGILSESGQSIASVDPTTPKMFKGEPVQAKTKLSISGGKARTVSNDIRELTHALNKKLKLWNPNNPFIANGYMYNGSSQHLMNPSLVDKIEKIKPTFGDIDIIIPKSRGGDVEAFLDGIDDNNPKWEPRDDFKITNNFYYVGRTRSNASIPDQTVTLWYYKPTDQIVQIDFEHDDMQIVNVNGNKFQKPSDWTKFSKDSPWDDLESGIKGLAGALMLRSLTRAATRIDDAVVLTPGGAKKMKDGKELTPRDITTSTQHSLPSHFTLNTGGGGAGIRRAYNKVGTMSDGKAAYEFIDAKTGKTLGKDFALIVDIPTIFEVLFNKKPSADELNKFRSFKGLLKFMKRYLDKKTIVLALKRFQEQLKLESLSPIERNAINDAIKLVLKS